jgi:predicted permease
MATAIERIGAVPGVTGVGTTSSLPMTEGDSDIDFAIEGRTLAVDEQPPASWFRMVSPSYFDVMEMRIIDGRGFTTADRAGDGVPFAIVVNEEFQRRHFPDGAVGGRLRFGERSAEIVGVVADTRHRGLGEEAVTEMFLSAAQVGNRSVTFVVRTPLDAAAAGAAVRDALRAIDPALPPPAFITMEHLVAQTIALPRLYSAFFAFFAAVALLLAAVGVYGLTAYAVGQRRQEIGIRVALGARSADVVGMVVRRSMTLTIAGIVIGLIAAFALARPLAVLRFDMSAHDIATFAAVPAILAGITLAASWIPARGAAQVDPLEALRRD